MSDSLSGSRPAPAIPAGILAPRIARVAWNVAIEYTAHVTDRPHRALPYFHELDEVQRERLGDIVRCGLALRDILPDISPAIFMAVAGDMISATQDAEVMP